jgi:hypothetical protein
LVAVLALAVIAARSGHAPDHVWVLFGDRHQVALLALEPEGEDLRNAETSWSIRPMDPGSVRGPEPEIDLGPSSPGWLNRALCRVGFSVGRCETYWRSGRVASGRSGTWIEYGRIVGDFWHTVGDPQTSPYTMVTMLADGSIAGVPGATWRRDGRHMWLTWPDHAAPGGSWCDACVLSYDETTYEGRNQDGLLIRGSQPVGE